VEDEARVRCGRLAARCWTRCGSLGQTVMTSGEWRSWYQITSDHFDLLSYLHSCSCTSSCYTVVCYLTIVLQVLPLLLWSCIRLKDPIVLTPRVPFDFSIVSARFRTVHQDVLPPLEWRDLQFEPHLQYLAVSLLLNRSDVCNTKTNKHERSTGMCNSMNETLY